MRKVLLAFSLFSLVVHAERQRTSVSVTVNTVVENFSTEERLNGAIASFEGDLGRTGPNGGTQLKQSVRTRSNSRVNLSACAAYPDFFTQCQNFSVSGNRYAVTEWLRFRLTRKSGFVSLAYERVTGENIPSEVFNSVYSRIGAKGIEGTADLVLTTDEGQVARAEFFLGTVAQYQPGFTYGPGDVSQVVELLVTKPTELAAFSTYLRGRGLKPALLVAVPYLTIVVNGLFEKLLYREPTPAERVANRVELLKNNSQKAIAAHLLAKDEVRADVP
jgi:hypothetical protein